MRNRSWLAVITAVGALTSLVIPSPAQAAQTKVVASFSVLGDMVARIGGEHVAVVTLVGPNGDAHVYEPSPKDAQAIAASDLLVVNGLGFEGWMTRLREAAGHQGRMVTATNGVQTREMVHGDHTETDPHAFQSLSNGLVYVANITTGLCAADPQHCTTFQANAKTYRDEIAALDAELKSQLGALASNQRLVITSHDAFGYFAAAYGLEFKAPEGFSTESEASAKDVAALITQIRETGARALFVENMSDPRLVEQIARETGARIGGTLYADSLSPPGQAAASYLAMFRHNARQLIAALADGS